MLQNITNKYTLSLSQFSYKDKDKEHCCNFIPVCSLFPSREQTCWLWSEKLQIIAHSSWLFHSLISSLLSRYGFLVAVFRQNPAFSTDLRALTFLQHFVGINGLLHALHVSLHFQPHSFVNRKQETYKSSSLSPNYCFIEVCSLSLSLTVNWNEPTYWVMSQLYVILGVWNFCKQMFVQF